HLLRCLEGLPSERRLPVDVRATAFQWKVYEALLSIPPGSTMSYGALARSLGRPKGARAVARACATNRVAVVIPCHRVVRGDGSLGGYRWGMKRKQALLEAERGAAAGKAGAMADLTAGRGGRPARPGAPLSS